MNRLSKYFTEYLDAKVMFALDLFLSVVSSVLILLVLNIFDKSHAYSGSFAICWIGSSALFSCLTIYFSHGFEVVVRHTTIRDFVKCLLSVASKDALMLVTLAVLGFFSPMLVLALFCDIMLTFLLVLSVRLLMILVFDAYKAKVKDVTDRQRVLVYGTSDKSVAAISRFLNSPHYRILGFLTANSQDRNLRLSKYPVYTYSSIDDFKALAERLSVGAVLFSLESDLKREEKDLVAYCAQHNIKTLIIPTVDEVIGGRIMKGGIRQVRIEDLLGRPEIRISMDEIRKNFQGKVIMVTGAAGSIGSELCRQLATFGVKQLVLFDNAETPMHNLRLELEARYPQLDFVPVIGSVRHPARLDFAFRTWKPQVVFHAAAYKHVPLMEENPCEAVFANVFGSRMVADKCVEYGVGMMVMISTDKAVNPTNIMGCSKRLAEIYVQSLGLALAKGEVKGKTKFVTTRFGNVLGSNGSVIPRFREQIENGGPVTVTHPEITRFFMTIPEACRLVMEAATLSTGNQIFVFDMGESVKIADLARRMIELAGLKPDEDIQIEYTGLRPGEKLYEEVLANSENTVPTSHDRIRIAKVREYDYAEVINAVDELTALAKSCDVPAMVQLMKKVVPEFKSRNSRFEVYDR